MRILVIVVERIVVNASPMIALEHLHAQGFRLSERLIAMLLRDAGEG
jgi:hypothetical protein